MPKIRDRARDASIYTGAEQGGPRRCLAVERGVVNIVRADHGSRQLLHQVALFIGAFRRSDERHRVWTALRLDLGQFAGDEGKSFIPAGLAKLASLAN